MSVISLISASPGECSYSSHGALLMLGSYMVPVPLVFLIIFFPLFERGFHVAQADFKLAMY